MALFHPIITPSIGVYLLSCLHPAYEKSRELVRARKKYYGMPLHCCFALSMFAVFFVSVINFAKLILGLVSIDFVSLFGLEDRMTLKMLVT